MKELNIRCGYIENVTPLTTGDVDVTLKSVDKDFIDNLEIKDIVSYADNKKLFKAIIENDEDILHNYLQQSGYIFNKA